MTFTALAPKLASACRFAAPPPARPVEPNEFNSRTDDRLNVTRSFAGRRRGLPQIRRSPRQHQLPGLPGGAYHEATEQGTQSPSVEQRCSASGAAVRVGGHPSIRSGTRITCANGHSPPRELGTPRSFKPAATARRLVFPAARSSLTIGARSAARQPSPTQAGSACRATMRPACSKMCRLRSQRKPRRLEILRQGI